MDDDYNDQLELLQTVTEGVMQAQELVVQSLVASGLLNKKDLLARLEHALKQEDVRLGAQMPLLRLQDVLKDRPPPRPRWTPRLVYSRNEPAPD